MTLYTYDVTMTCSGCSGAVTRVLSKLQGVDKFDVSLETQKVTVESSTLSQEEILERFRRPARLPRLLLRSRILSCVFLVSFLPSLMNNKKKLSTAMARK
ncbi:unnamed protein product [Mortierella alpina]